MHPATISRSRLLSGLLLLLTATLLSACGDRGTGAETGADVEDINEEDVVEEDVVEAEPEEVEPEPEPEADSESASESASEPAADEVFADPESYLGEQVTVSGQVSEVVDANSFRIGGEDVGGEALLVTSADQANVEPDQNVQVTGTVQQFNLGEFEDEYGFDYDEGLYGDFEGEPVIVADSVEPLAGAESEGAGAEAASESES
jgi:hypothetical protein